MGLRGFGWERTFGNTPPPLPRSVWPGTCPEGGVGALGLRGPSAEAPSPAEPPLPRGALGCIRGRCAGPAVRSGGRPGGSPGGSSVGGQDGDGPPRRGGGGRRNAAGFPHLVVFHRFLLPAAQRRRALYREGSAAKKTPNPSGQRVFFPPLPSLSPCSIKISNEVKINSFLPQNELHVQRPKVKGIISRPLSQRMS